MIVVATCCKNGCENEAAWLMNESWLLCPTCLPEAISVVKEVADATADAQAVRLVRLESRFA